MRIPESFYLARSATILIHRGGAGDDEYSVEVLLDDGNMFPRKKNGKLQGGVKVTRFGPVPIDSPIEEHMKFKDILQLHTLLDDPTKSDRVETELVKIVREDQAAEYLGAIQAALNGHAGHFRFGTENETFELSRAPTGPKAQLVKGRLILPSGQWTEEQNGNVKSTADVAEVRITARATPEHRIAVTAELHEAVIRLGAETIGHQSLQRPFTVAMTPAVEAIAQRPVKYYINSDAPPKGREALLREFIYLRNSIYSEIHARLSFAVSCLILVIVGCALGMMFKSGNFLTAFAISVAPALLCIALIATGQHTAEDVPWNLQNFHNGLMAGITLIWSGNVMVLILAVVLMWRLQRQ
jgi:hypothetical protein